MGKNKVICIDSEPLTGKGMLVAFLVREGFCSGNEAVSSPTLRLRFWENCQDWCFEYLLSLILHFRKKMPNPQRVVYENLHMEHTLIPAFRKLGYINEFEETVLRDCCDKFIPKFPPEQVTIVYSSSEANLLASFLLTENKEGLMTNVHSAQVFKESFGTFFVSNPTIHVITLDSTLPYFDSVVREKVLKLLLQEQQWRSKSANASCELSR